MIIIRIVTKVFCIFHIYTVSLLTFSIYFFVFVFAFVDFFVVVDFFNQKKNACLFASLSMANAHVCLAIPNSL